MAFFKLESAKSLFRPWLTPKPSQVYTPLAEDEDTEKRRGSSLSSGGVYAPPPQRRRPVLTYILIGLSSVNLLCLLLLFFVNNNNNNNNLPVNNGRKEVAPEMPMGEVIFDQHKLFMGPPTTESNAAWDGILPPGRGFVFVENPDQFQLRKGLPTKFGIDIYSVSMFHQLHCLGVLRSAYWKILNGVSNHDEGIEKEAHRQMNDDHTMHCFDYIRQGIMCSGDMTMEWPKPIVNSSSVDGWGIPHKCKSWDSIWDYMITKGYNASSNHHIEA